MWHFMPLGSHVSDHSSSMECLSKARQWLLECGREHHAGHCPHLTEVELPTRVICVGNDSTDPHLYEPSSHTKGTYAALSYCWGNCYTFTNTTQTYPQLKNGFKLSSLPKTCRDAALVARALSIHYLWIDQLCIIQDSDEDWENESSKMCSIYQNACVTLAAVDGLDCNTGLFVPTKGWRTVSIECALPDGSPAHVSIRAWSDNNLANSPYRHDTTVTLPDNILHTRGWTLQEISLSPRILWFGSTELGWSCLTNNAHESEPYLPNGLIDEHVPPNVIQRRAVASKPSSFRECMDYWQKIIQDFTGRVLTEPRDRLPALAGLAAVFQKHFNDQYLAGIWRQDIGNQLLWAIWVDVSYEELEDLSQYKGRFMPAKYGPSWSWCSVFGIVIWIIESHKRNFIPDWTILDVQYEPTSRNKFGPGAGVLQISGLLLQIRLSDVQFKGVAQIDGAEQLIPFCTSDCFLPDPRTPDPGLQRFVHKPLFFLFAGHRNVPPHDVDMCTGLVVEPVTQPSQDMHFQRVGLIEAPFTCKDDAGGRTGWAQYLRRITLHLE
ncbi:HET-domain-containing protein [Polychaeton citri CBS 116435]|uniref:HET-domain-containing protein n=1 Tax=Polychaeton citri CBS 116435 TaxID=1314669 RepID=A0A9P4QFR4_9PEZI|nr:HET-domain-containing protein [Polychaeton citri CBS 116435]